MNRPKTITYLTLLITSTALILGGSLDTLNAQTEPLKLPPIADGPFKPDWDSLTQLPEAPEWFRDAKFGIWAHWGPQCQPEHGDWYARSMYEEGSWQLQIAPRRIRPSLDERLQGRDPRLEGGAFRSRQAA